MFAGTKAQQRTGRAALRAWMKKNSDHRRRDERARGKAIAKNWRTFCKVTTLSPMRNPMTGEEVGPYFNTYYEHIRQWKIRSGEWLPIEGD